MRDNTRRNRNIGTSKQGYGLNNKMKIPHPIYGSDLKWFPERLGKYQKIKRKINEHEFVFIVEELHLDAYHSCSVDDVAKIIKHIPLEDYGDLKFIVFRQPKRKEMILSSVWGRLIYYFEFEDECYPAIILESIQYDGKLKWPRKLSVELQIDMERLKRDGHIFNEDKRYYHVELLPENVRQTQLYRTLLHEFGHYVQFLNVVEKPASEDEEYEEWEKRWDFYHDSIPSSEKEKFAHTYAEKLRNRLEEEGIIPFTPEENTKNDLENNTK